MIRSFLIAVSFLTRVPISHTGDVSDQEVTDSSTYFGLVGLVVGASQGFVFWLLFPISPLVAAVGSTSAAALVTGAFHHDGLADAADAFVGGWTPEQRREILKDSRLGTYGVMALVLVVLFEVALLAELEPAGAITGLIAAHTISRTAAVFLAAFSAERGQGLGRLISANVSYRIVTMGLLTAAIFLVSWWWAFSAIEAGLGYASLTVGAGLCLLVVSVALAGRYAKSKVGVVTGDTLGAVERISFNILLLSWVVLHTV